MDTVWNNKEQKVCIKYFQKYNYRQLAQTRSILIKNDDWHYELRVFWNFARVTLTKLRRHVNCKLVARSRLAGWANVEIELRSVQIEPAPDTLEDNPLFATGSLSNGIVRFSTLYECADVIKKMNMEKTKKKES